MVSIHAAQRMQQRAVSNEMIDLLMDYGVVEYHRGAEIISLNKKCWKKLQDENPCGRQTLDKVRNCYVVISDGVVVTVGHKKTHFKHNRH